MAYQAGMQEEITVRKGPWLEEEDKRLATFVTLMGERRWDSIARVSGLRRSGKSCRLRWLNYLRPDLKRGRMSEEEEHVILQLQKQWGNKWSKIARRLPGRTDNEIKNYWRTHLRKKEVQVQKQEILLQGEKTNVASNSWSSSKAIEHGGYVNENMLRPSKDFLDGLELRDHRVLSFLPWETGLFDWISDNQNSPKHQEHCLLGCSSCSPGWLCGDADSTVWNCTMGSMWDT